MSGHGTRSRFVNQGCRCLPCRAANARYQAGRERKIRQGKWDGLRSPVHARRLAHSLAAEGFTKRELARRLGLTKFVIKRRIRPTTEMRLQRFYDALMAEEAA